MNPIPKYRRFGGFAGLSSLARGPSRDQCKLQLVLAGYKQARISRLLVHLRDAPDGACAHDGGASCVDDGNAHRGGHAAGGGVGGRAEHEEGGHRAHERQVEQYGAPQRRIEKRVENRSLDTQHAPARARREGQTAADAYAVTKARARKRRRKRA
eukprot:6202177-Pleurochrysis_carterae.AAC.2